MNDTPSKKFTWQSAWMSAKDLPPTTRHVLHVISSYINIHGGGAYPSQETIAIKSGLSLRAVKQHVKLAYETGWITKSNLGLRGQKWAQNEYFPSYPERWISLVIDEKKVVHEMHYIFDKVVQDVHHVPQKVVQEIPEGGAGGAPKVVQEVHSNIKGNKNIIKIEEETRARKLKNQKIKKGALKHEQTPEQKLCIDEHLTITEPIPDRYLDAARAECGADDEQIIRQYRTWYYWVAGHDQQERSPEQWLAKWCSWVCKNIGRGNSAPTDRAGSIRAGAGTTTGAARRALDRLRNKKQAQCVS